MALVIKNNAVGLLLTGIVAGATSTTLQPGHTMPVLGAGDYCFATYVSSSNTVEVVKVTAITGDVITHAATVNAFDASSLFELRPCKEAVDAIMQEASVKAAVTLAGTDTYTGTASPVPISYVGLEWVLKFPNANTITTPSVNLNGLGAKTILNRDGVAPAAGDIKAGSVHIGYYDGTNMVLVTLVSAIAQIQSIGAAVAANALTISAGRLTLDFRSATLTSGAVTTVIGTPANLVISSGSTLGTTSGVKSRIAVLALNNAGAIELAAVNIGGGNDLTETGVISTTAEGGAGGADTINIAYSTTARSNLAYRVIGYVESTQATAGTWATAPSTIQGAGGEAFTAMSSIGYGQTWQDVTGSRASATTYRNDTGRPIMIAITGAGTPGGVALTIGGVAVSQSVMGGATSGNWSCTGIVPPGNSYSAVITGALLIWAELK